MRNGKDDEMRNGKDDEMRNEEGGRRRMMIMMRKMGVEMKKLSLR